MHIHEARVMAALHKTDKPATVADLVEATGDRAVHVRNSVQSLRWRGLLAEDKCGLDSAWRLSRQGRGFAETRRGRSLLDVPPMAGKR